MPRAYDLRECGWLLADEDDDAVCLSDLSRTGREPALTLVVGMGDPAARASLLRQGYGDVVGDCELVELAARAARLAEWVPRYRRQAALELDLVARDAFVSGRALNLHPREFGLLWRLMATPGQVVGKALLLREVWRLRHLPETNSLAVHACRLRGKLRSRGLADMIATEGDGYRFRGPAVPLQSAVDNLDAHLRLTCDPPLCETVSAQEIQA